MYPYDEKRGFAGWRTWFLASRFAHTAEATRDIVGLPKHVREIVQRRRTMLATFGRIRGFVLLGLYFGIIVTAAAFLMQFLPETGVLQVLRFVGRITGALAGVLAAAYLILTRLLGQTEADLIGLLLTHRGRPRKA